MNRKAILIVLDSVGIGALPDAAAYGDAGADTLGHVINTCHPRIPNLMRLGLGNIDGAGFAGAVDAPQGSFGRLREVCGAVSGMTMVLSNKFACADPNNHEKKAELYSLIQQAAGEFREENGSIICRELLGLSEKSSSPNPEERTKEYYKKRPCAELVRCAAEIAEKYLDNKE